MKRPISEVPEDRISAKRKGAKPYLNWEGIYFLTVALFLLFQEYFLAIDITGVASSLHVLYLYVHFTSFMLAANKVLAALFFCFYFYATFASTSTGPPRTLCDFLGAYYFLRMITLLAGLNILIFDVTSSRFLLITHLVFFLPYSLLVWAWVYWRLDAAYIPSGRPLFRLEHETENPRVVDYFVAAFSTAFSASISAIKGTSARSRILILFYGLMIYGILGLILSRAVALAHQ
jgi:hypothetical protein